MKPQRLGVRVFVPGERGSGCVYRVKTIMVNRVEFNQIQKWRALGYQSKSSMVLSRYSHRVYTRHAK